MTAKRHHYVPRFYLRRFTSATHEDQLHAWNVRDGKYFTTSSANICVERDFLRVELDGVAPDAIETSMSGFEDRAAAALSALVEKEEVPDGDNYQYVVNLVALLAVRHPRMRENWRKIQSARYRQMFAPLVETPERWEEELAAMKGKGYMAQDASLPFEKARDFLKEEHYRLDVPRERFIELETEAHDKILKLLGQRYWSVAIVETAAGSFITSDHPVALVWNRPGMHPRQPPFDAPLTSILFPVTPRILLVGQFEQGALPRKANRRLVAATNEMMLASAYHHVFAWQSHFFVLDRPGGIQRVEGLLPEALRQQLRQT